MPITTMFLLEQDDEILDLFMPFFLNFYEENDISIFQKVIYEIK